MSEILWHRRKARRLKSKQTSTFSIWGNRFTRLIRILVVCISVSVFNFDLALYIAGICGVFSAIVVEPNKKQLKINDNLTIPLMQCGIMTLGYFER